jgi:hypothetical protein
VIGALRVDAEYGKEADDYAVVDVAIDWVIE